MRQVMVACQRMILLQPLSLSPMPGLLVPVACGMLSVFGMHRALGARERAGIRRIIPGSTVPRSASPASIAACYPCYCDSIEAIQTAFGPHAHGGSIPNYTDIEPTIRISEVKIYRLGLLQAARPLYSHSFASRRVASAHQRIAPAVSQSARPRVIAQVPCLAWIAACRATSRIACPFIVCTRELPEALGCCRGLRR
jgi:hypothetical protein